MHSHSAAHKHTSCVQTRATHQPLLKGVEAIGSDPARFRKQLQLCARAHVYMRARAFLYLLFQFNSHTDTLMLSKISTNLI